MSVSQVRLLIADPERYDRATATADGVQIVFETPHSPIVVGSYAVRVNNVLQTEGVDYIIDTAVGVVTFMVAPPLDISVVITYKHTILSDSALTALLSLEGDVVKLAAAQALDIIASNEVLIQKRIRLLDLSTDGPGEAAALREHARALREQVAAEASFDWAEMVLDDATYRERIWKEQMRS